MHSKNSKCEGALNKSNTSDFKYTLYIQQLTRLISPLSVQSHKSEHKISTLSYSECDTKVYCSVCSMWHCQRVEDDNHIVHSSVHSLLLFTSYVQILDVLNPQIVGRNQISHKVALKLCSHSGQVRLLVTRGNVEKLLEQLFPKWHVPFPADRHNVKHSQCYRPASVGMCRRDKMVQQNH